MKYKTCLLIFTAACSAGCGSTAVNVNMNANVRNVNTSPPAANLSPAMPPPTMMPSNTIGGNAPRGNSTPPRPGMANEKMTPATHPPGYLGPPIKKP